MTTRQLLTFQLETALDWFLPCAKNMADKPLVQPTLNGGNHPLWVVGHCAFAEAGMLAMILGEDNPLQHWSSTFGGGTQPTSDARDYPRYEEVLKTFEDVRARTLEVLAGMSEDELAAPCGRIPEGHEDSPNFQCRARMFSI
ncbi:MAG: DinB family protein, partial [Planctomycetota bacterium]